MIESSFLSVVFIILSIMLIFIFILGLIRALKGPTLFDRILAGNMIGTTALMLIIVLGFLMNRPDFLDIALLYALINFTGMIAILKFIKVNTKDQISKQETDV